MTQRITLIRHAEATCNKLPDTEILHGFDVDADLTERGRVQVRALVSKLEREPFAPVCLYSSPLRRARATADALGGAMGCDVRVDERLAELRAPAVFDEPLEVRQWDAVLARRIIAPEEEPFPGVESLRSQYDRVRDFLCDRDRGGESHIVVAHAFTVELALVHLLGLGLQQLARFRFKVSNTGVFVVERRDRDLPATLVASNSKSHLDRIV